MYDYAKHIISEKASLVDALRQLNGLSGQTMVLFAVDAEGKMTGTLTDGDVRRFLIRDSRLDVAVGDIMHRAFRFLDAESIDLAKVRELRRQEITLVPCLDSCGKIRQVFNFSECHSILPLDAVLMAGGRGERAANNLQPA